MSWKFSCHSSSSSSASSSCAFYKGGRLLLSSITIITIALLVLLPSPSSLFSFYVNANDFVVFASPSSSVSQSETTTVPVPPPPQTISSQSSQSESQEEVGPSADNFNLSDGYIIEPFLSNLSMPTSIAVDSANGTLYVAESIKEYDNNNNSSIMLSTSSSSPVSFLSQQAQIRIVKDAISGNNNSSIIVNQTHDSSSGGVINIDNNTTFINNALNWPVIDMEVDDASGLLYAFHDHTTISRINTTSGEREDIITTEEEPDAGSDKYEEEQQQDPLSLLVSSSSQIALSGKEDYLDGRSADDEHGGGNYDNYNSSVLYIPCMNGDVDSDYGTYCILGLPIDRSGNNAIVDNIRSLNSSSFILENMTSRPVGIAILNSSSHVAAAASSSSSIISEQQGPYTLIGSQTPNSFGNNNDSELLIITSQPTRNTLFNNSNNYSADALSSLSTIYHAKTFGSIPYQRSSSNNLQDTTNNNNNYSDSNNNNHQQQPALLPSIDALVDYPHGQLGQVAVVFARPVSASPISTNETTERSQATSTDEDIVSSSSSPSFGLNETTAFMIDFGNSSASAASATLSLPRIMMLDVQSGSITQFLTLKHPDPNFTPIDIAFDYNNSALYVLSSGNNNQEEDTNNTTNNTNNSLQNTGGSRNNNISSGVIWKISYQGLGEGEATTSSNNSTSDLETPPPPPPDSLNETDSSSNSSDDDIDSDDTSATETSYDEEEDDIDDFEDDIDDIEDDDSSSTDNSNGSSSSDDDNDGSSSSSPSSPPSSDSSPPPSTPQPVNDAPIAEDDAATTDQDTPVVIDVLANDMDTDNDNPLTIDSVDEESIQGGNVRIISSSSGGSNDDGGGGDDNNNGGGSNTNEKIEYTPAEGFFGNDEFTYTIIDRNGATDSSRVTVTVNEVILVPHPIIYWLENEGGITQDLLEKAAEGHDNNNDDDVDEWSFNLGNFRVPVEFDVLDNENDTKGILEGGEGNNNNDDDNTNAYDQLAAQLLTSKLNIENGVTTCESIETTIEYADTVLRNALYNGPGSTENPISESRDYAFELIEILDRYNNEGCV